MDGTLISTFTDPKLQRPWGVHVTLAGQVFVCGNTSHTAIQVDHEGKKKLAQIDGVTYPISVWVNTNIEQIIVGTYGTNKIVVLELQ
ncbi:hypothetical protein DPMN_183546 [Dreissena polymorpha]|uniref:Uncharacterized protein n=2 Tax=Dreissena polymorpha TaxID=45954 RepID=A0A9D4DHS2_DREPO|nr:hypothetical protein DPMN_183546 [Dreissena polymorpha]